MKGLILRIWGIKMQIGKNDFRACTASPAKNCFIAKNHI
jgi:hypothetical protein